jgi:hypothetical protein
MNGVPSRDVRLEKLIAAMFDGSLAADEHAELLQIIDRDAAACDQFLSQIALHAVLKDEARGTRPKALCGELFGVSSADLPELVAGVPPKPAIVDVEPSQPFCGDRPTLTLLLDVFLLRGFAPLARAAAAILFVAFCVGALLFVDRPERVPFDHNQIVVGAEPQISEVQHILLDSGTTRVKLPNVGHVVISGPADFRLLSPMRARLNYGRIKMRVTEKTGHGFVVETPDGDITDLGTEFGIDVGEGRSSMLAVFEGMVDLEVAEQMLAQPRVERLLGGDGVLFNRGGTINRLGSIRTGELATFACTEGLADFDDDSLIARVYDNLPATSTRRFYEIVPEGMKEDAIAFVDRLQHNWNGLSRGGGLPLYLRKADYIKTFCEDKFRTDDEFELTVVLNRPAKLYVLFDKRLRPPDWLTESFTKTEDCVGLDMGKWYSLDEVRKGESGKIGTGAGHSIDVEFTVWERLVDKPGPVKLGPNGKNHITKLRATMYGVVAQDLQPMKSASANKKVKLKKPPKVGKVRNS